MRQSPAFHYEKALSQGWFTVLDKDLTEYLKWGEEEVDTVNNCLKWACDIVEEYLWFDVNQYMITQYCTAHEGKIEFARFRPDYTQPFTVQYFDADNQLQTLVENTDYIVIKSFLSYIKLINIPSTYDREDAYTITYITGYQSTALVPPKIKACIYRLAAYLFEVRIDEKRTDMSFVEQLCYGMREFRF